MCWILVVTSVRCLMPLQFDPVYSSIEFRQTDVMQLDDSGERFNLVLNCSTIEHVGLGGRYNSTEAPDGDLEAMQEAARVAKKICGVPPDTCAS